MAPSGSGSAASHGELVVARCTIRIDGEVDEEARGVGHTTTGDEACVHGALPGELVRARVIHRSRRNRVFAVVDEVLEPSNDRVPTRCPHFLDCGGCDFLHATHEMQHAYKRSQVAAALGLPIDRVEPVLASPRALGYRALAKLVVGPGGILGSYRPRTHDVVDMRGCLVHAPEVERVADAIRDAIAGASVDLRYAIVRASLHEGRAVVTLVARTERASGLHGVARALSERSDVARVVLDVNDGDGDALVSGHEITLFDGPAPNERIGTIEQSLEVGAFAQVNPLAAAVLYDRVRLDADAKDKRVLDLYSGSGGIALTLAADAASVVGIEAHEAAVRAARRTAPNHVSFVHASVEEGLLEAGRAEVVIMNPPRKGASAEVILALAELRPARLIYVSCHPQSLARDLGLLGSRVPINIRRVTPVDLFPETRHVETVVALDIG